MNIYLEAFSIFFKIGAFTIGGGYAMVPLIENEIVTKHLVPGIKDGASFLQRLDWVISSSQPWSPQVKKITFTEVKW